MFKRTKTGLGIWGLDNWECVCVCEREKEKGRREEGSTQKAFVGALL